MYRGLNAINLDEKGRLALPTRYRDILYSDADNELVVTIDTEEKCLLLYPLPDWENIEAKLEALPSFNPAARRVQRLLIGHACEVTLDNSGRILLPQVLRDYAELEKQVMLVGQGKKFEIWSAANWEARRKEWLTLEAGKVTALPIELQTLSL
jgi:MraZ protein